jgi:hypothetical protein
VPQRRRGTVVWRVCHARAVCRVREGAQDARQRQIRGVLLRRYHTSVPHSREDAQASVGSRGTCLRRCALWTPVRCRTLVCARQGDIVLISKREFQDSKADVIMKYTAEEARELKKRKWLPENGARRQFSPVVCVCRRLCWRLCARASVRLSSPVFASLCVRQFASVIAVCRCLCACVRGEPAKINDPTAEGGPGGDGDGKASFEFADFDVRQIRRVCHCVHGAVLRLQISRMGWVICRLCVGLCVAGCRRRRDLKCVSRTLHPYVAFQRVAYPCGLTIDVY